MSHQYQSSSTERPSVHVEPRGLYETAQHYVGDFVYGANDGILTTFAVVAGATGGALSARAVIIVGVANLFADGLSMGVGNYLSIRARESALEHSSGRRKKRGRCVMALRRYSRSSSLEPCHSFPISRPLLTTGSYLL